MDRNFIPSVAFVLASSGGHFVNFYRAFIARDSTWFFSKAAQSTAFSRCLHVETLREIPSSRPLSQSSVVKRTRLEAKGTMNWRGNHTFIHVWIKGSFHEMIIVFKPSLMIWKLLAAFYRHDLQWVRSRSLNDADALAHLSELQLSLNYK